MTAVENILNVAFWVVTLIPAIVLHEVSHGYIAHRMGDHTAKVAGRLTLNPIKHVDPFGTVILPGLLLLPRLFGQGGVVFGYAKPVPVNPANLRRPERQMVGIALAGPLTNLLLAALGAIAFRVTLPLPGSRLIGFFEIWITLNVLIAVFNVMPIPPLDGSKVLAFFLPPRARDVYRSMEPYGALFMLAIFFLFPGAIFAIVGPIVQGLIGLLVG
jgi:Zn-dependent protease